MVIFVSDIDNTLIFSHKIAEINSDICVEYKDGKPLSYMRADCYTELQKIFKKCIFIPVTTRSCEQYRRLNIGIAPVYALAANGALLFVNGVIDKKWREQTFDIIKTPPPVIKNTAYTGNIRVIEGLYIQIKTQYPARLSAQLRAQTDPGQYTVTAAGNKVYVIPKTLDKGLAIRRIREYLCPDKIIAAGDSELDIPMLNEADIAIYPASLDIEHKNAYKIEAPDPREFTAGVMRVAGGLFT